MSGTFFSAAGRRENEPTLSSGKSPLLVSVSRKRKDESNANAIRPSIYPHSSLLLHACVFVCALVSFFLPVKDGRRRKEGEWARKAGPEREKEGSNGGRRRRGRSKRANKINPLLSFFFRGLEERVSSSSSRPLFLIELRLHVCTTTAVRHVQETLLRVFVLIASRRRILAY